MMEIDPDVFHSELRELIGLLQCNPDIDKLEELVRRDPRYRYISEETFDTFMVLSDERKQLAKLKEKMGKHQDENEKVVYDMCRAFEQLEQRGQRRGEKIGEQRGIQIGERRGEQRINELYAFLMEQERYEDMRKAMGDREYRRELYKELQMV